MEDSEESDLMTEKEEYNLMTEKEELQGRGPQPPRSVFTQLRQHTYVKDQRIQMFKFKMNTFIVNIIKQFFLLIDEKRLSEF